MLNSSVIQILRTFSATELKSFCDFAASPYYNKKTSLTRLLKQIRKFSPEFDDKMLDREILWKGVYPDKKYNYGVMKNLVYDVTKLAERFLEIQMFENDTLQKTKYILENLRERSLNKIFLSKMKQVEKYVSENHYVNEKFPVDEIFYLLSRIYVIHDNFLSRNYPAKSTSELTDISCNYLFNSFLISSFKSFNNMIVDQVHENHDQNNNMLSLLQHELLRHGVLEKIINEQNQNGNKSPAAFRIYYLLFKSFAEYTTENYFKFKEELFNTEPELPRADIYDLWTTIGTTLNIPNTELDKNAEYLEIYKMRVKKNLFLGIEGNMDEKFFESCISSASLAGDHEFIELLIKDFLNKLPVTAIESMSVYANAHLYFAKKDFGRALEFISKSRIDFFRMKFSLKALQLMSYYELEDYNALDAGLNSYLHFIGNNSSIGKYIKTALKNFCKCLTHLYKIRENSRHEKIPDFKIQVLEIEVYRKKWFIKKIEELSRG